MVVTFQGVMFQVARKDQAYKDVIWSQMWFNLHHDFDF